MSDYWGNTNLQSFSSNNLTNLRGVRILIGVGSLAISGGTNLILEYAQSLKRAGAEVSIGFMTGKGTDAEWHPHAKAFQYERLSNFSEKHFDLGIITWNKTMFPMLKLNCHKYLYFVQSLETRFSLNYQDTKDIYDVAATYMSGIPMITVASWLQNLLMTHTPSKTWLVLNGIDRDVFPLQTIKEDLKGNELSVVVEGALHVPMKAVSETLSALSDISGIRVIHCNPEPGKSAFADKTYNSLPITEMKNVYAKADVLVKMSRVEGMFGPPLEAFHSGVTAIASKVTGYDEYLRHNFNSLLVDVDDLEAMHSEILRLRDNRALLNELKNGALETARNWPDIKTTGMHFANICYSVLSSEHIGRFDTDALLAKLTALSENRNFPLPILAR